jgi:tetratricopeptide (TPR) repeat protein
MKKQTTLSVVSTCLVSCILAWATPALVSQAAAAEKTAEAEKPKKKKRVKRSATLRPQIFKKLDKARALADEGKFNDALGELKSLEKRKRNSYETAMTHNMYAYVYFNQENTKGAIKAYSDVLTVKNIPDSLRQTTLYSIAKLHLMEEEYDKALGPLNEWFGMVEKPGAEAYVLRAQTYYQLENYKKALPDVKTAIAMTKDAGNPPRENWLMLERAVYYQNKDFNNLARCLQDLATLYPKAQYWVQLAAVYSELGQPKKELATLESAFDQGMLKKENELISLAQALLGLEIPFKAAKILEDGMEKGAIEANARNLSLLGDAWMIAKEYDNALVAMNKAAVESQQGKDFFKLAQIYTERQEWQLALENVDKALKLGGLSQEHTAHVLKGLVLFNLDDLSDAKAAFAKAKTYEKSERAANQWLDYIKAEEQRRAYMAASS